MKQEVFSRHGGGAARFARRLALGSIVVLAFAALGAASLQAAKPPPPPPPVGGTIYYTVGSQLWSMNPDGSGKTLLPVVGEPSRLLHGGYRWFLQGRQVGTYPNGKPHNEIFAVRGDGNESFTRQLTDSPVVEPLSGSTWLPGDAAISVHGRLWDWEAGGDCMDPAYPEFNPCVVDGGIYGVDVHFDLSGNVDSLPADPGAPIVAIELTYWNGGDQVRLPNVSHHDWSPDAAEIAYSGHGSNGAAPGMKVFVVATGDTRILADKGRGPIWSPDGSKIMFTNLGIYTIAPDGSGLKLIIRQSSQYGVGGGSWSPTGSHITYRRYSGQIIIDTYASDVYRATEAGGSLTNLTGDVAGWASPANWR